mmetsp:Transcript_20447/g.64390  ORF Transcript_20447/g.64390 Transcript_20447/m.64390 type:complete len:210 (-) Transcript_20447:1684-2313(-)
MQAMLVVKNYQVPAVQLQDFRRALGRLAEPLVRRHGLQGAFRLEAIAPQVYNRCEGPRLWVCYDRHLLRAAARVAVKKCERLVPQALEVLRCSRCAEPPEVDDAHRHRPVRMEAEAGRKLGDVLLCSVEAPRRVVGWGTPAVTVPAKDLIRLLVQLPHELLLGLAPGVREGPGSQGGQKAHEHGLRSLRKVYGQAAHEDAGRPRRLGQG